MLQFAMENPGSTTLIIAVLAYAVTRPFAYARRAYIQRLRAQCIIAHGWPQPPLDADGDIVYPDRDDD